MSRLTLLLLATLVSVALSAQPEEKRKMPDVPLMRQIFHTNIDKAQASILRSDGSADEFFAPGTDEQLSRQLTDELVNGIDNMQIDIEINSSLDNNNKIKYLRGTSEMLNAFDAAYRSRSIQAAQLLPLVKAYRDAMHLEKFGSSIAPVIDRNDLEVGEILVRLYPFEKNQGLIASKNSLVLKSLHKYPDRVMQIISRNYHVPFTDSVVAAVARRDQEEIYNYASA
ncbi:MAG TPA: hypothetical protein VF145_00290, partial [Chitinophagaceae bacterium]